MCINVFLMCVQIQKAVNYKKTHNTIITNDEIHLIIIIQTVKELKEYIGNEENKLEEMKKNERK